MITRLSSGRLIEKLRQKITKTFKDIGFDIEIMINLKQVNFLDITFNLSTETYQPYKKPNDELQYINVHSNHPPQIIKHLPKSINDRLSLNSSNEVLFNAAKGEYEAALKKSGYSDFKLTYEKPVSDKPKNRQRNIIWFNPPFNKNASTNVAKTFLKLIDKRFLNQTNYIKSSTVTPLKSAIAALKIWGAS